MQVIVNVGHVVHTPWRFAAAVGLIDVHPSDLLEPLRDVIEALNLCADAAAFFPEHRVGNEGAAAIDFRFTDRGLRHHFEVVGHIHVSSCSCRLESLTVRKRARCRPVTVPQPSDQPHGPAALVV